MPANITRCWVPGEAPKAAVADRMASMRQRDHAVNMRQLPERVHRPLLPPSTVGKQKASNDHFNRRGVGSDAEKFALRVVRGCHYYVCASRRDELIELPGSLAPKLIPRLNQVGHTRGELLCIGGVLGTRSM